jgi:hypothetical protein
MSFAKVRLIGKELPNDTKNAKFPSVEFAPPPHSEAVVTPNALGRQYLAESEVRCILTTKY